MTSMIRRSPLRTRLALTSALAGGLSLSTAAHAQNTPNGATVVAGVGVEFNGGGVGNASGAPTNLDVDLGINSNTIINWNGFDVSAGSTVNFDTSRSTPVAVLNRVTGPTASNIQGAITSDNNVAVWLLNPNGILIGSSGSISTGSFVGSTLGISDNDFLDIVPTGNYNLSGAANSTTGISIANGATITTSGGNRGLVLVAPFIIAGGPDSQFDAGGQDVAFVTATDVTLNYGLLGGPLQVQIARGTAVGGASQIVGGTVEGRNVTFALVAQQAVTDALLNVSAAVTATSAASTSRGIVLTGGLDAAGVDVAGTAGDTGGTVAINAIGALTAGGNGSIALVAGGALSATGLADAAVDYSAVGRTVTAGDIVAGRDISLAGELGVTAGSITADRDVDISAANFVTLGAISGRDITIEGSGSGAAPAVTIGSIDAADDVEIGTINAVGSVAINGATNAGGSLSVNTIGAQGYTGAVTAAEAIDLASTAGSITFAGAATSSGSSIEVAAGGAIGATGAITAADEISLTGAGITVGNVSSVGSDVSISASAGAVSTGALSADGSVTVNATGDASILGNVNAGDDFTVTAAGNAFVAAGVTAGSDYSVSAANIFLGDDSDAETQQAAGLVTITATDGNIVGGAGLTLRSNSNGSGPGDLTLQTLGTIGGDIVFAADSVLQGGPGRQSDIVVRSRSAANSVQLGNISANALRGAVAADGLTNGLTRDAGITLGNVDLVNSLRLRSETGNVAVGTVSVTGNNQGIDLQAPVGSLTAPGSLSSDGGITLIGGNALAFGTIDSDDGAVLVQSTGGAVTADNLFGNSVTVTAAGAATITGDVTARSGDYRVTGASVALGADAGAEIQQASGAIEIAATAGGITGGQNLTLRAVGTGDLTLTTAAAAAGGDIVFDASSRLQGGSSGTQRDVIVRSGTAGNVVTLGAVAARGLLGGVGADPVANGIVRDASITVGDVTLVNALALTSNLGNVGTGAISVTGAGQGITLQAANGTLTAPGSLTASGSIALTGGNSLAFGNLTSQTGSVSATSVGGTLSAGIVSGQTGVGLSANGDLSAVAANAAAGDVSLTSAAGGVTLGSAAASGNVGVTGVGAVAIAGNVTATNGTYRVTGGSVTLGADADAETHQAGGLIDITATSGAITGGPGLTLRSGTQAPSNLVLDAAGAIALGGTAIQAGGGAIGLRAGAGQTIALGAVTGASIGDVDAAHAVFATSLTRDASVSLGDVTVGSALAVATTAGDIATGNIAANAVALDASAGGVSMTGAVAAGDVTVSAALAATVSGNVTSGGNYSVSAQSVALGVDGDAEIQQAAGAVTIRANGGALSGGPGLTLRSDSDGAGGETLTLGLGAGSNLAFGGATLQGGADRSADIRVDYVGAAPALVFGDISARQFVSSDGVTTFTNSLNAGGGSVTAGDLDFSGDLIIQNASSIATGSAGSGAALILSSTGALDIGGPAGAATSMELTGADFVSIAGDATAGTSLSISSNGAVTAGATSAGTNATVTGGSVDLASLSAGSGAVSATANTGDLRLGTVTAGSTAALSAAGSVFVDTVGASGAVTIGSGGDVGGDAGPRANIASTNGSVTIDAANGAVRIGNGSAATGFAVDANGIDGLSVAGGGALALVAGAGGVTLGTASGASAMITTPGLVSIANGLTAAGDIAISANAAAIAPIVSDAGSVTITTSGGDYTGFGGGDADIDAGGAVTLAIAGAARIGTLNAASADISGTVVTIGSVTTTDTLDAVATTGNLVIGTGNAGGQITLEAANDLLFGTLQGGADVSLTAGGDILGSVLTAVGAASTTAGGTINIGNLDASGLLISAATIDIADIATPGSLTLISTSGDLTIGTGSAGSSVTLNSAGDLAVTNSLTAGGTASASAVGGATIQSVTSTGGDVIVDAASVSVGNANAAGAIDLAATAGDLTLGSGNAGTTATLRAAGDLAVTNALVAGDAVDAVATGDAAIGYVSGQAITVSGASVAIVDADSASLIAATATTGDIALDGAAGTTITLDAARDVVSQNGLVAGGAVAVDAGGDARLASVTTSNGAVRIDAAGGVSGIGGTRADLVAGGAGSTLSVTAGDAVLLGDANAAGGVGISAGAIDVTGIAAGAGAIDLDADAGAIALGDGAATGAVTVDATGAVAIGTLSGGSIAITGASLAATALDAGGAITATTSGAATLGTTDARGAVTVSAGGITAGATRAGGALSLTSTGGISLASGSAGTTATFDAAGIAALGQVDAASLISVTATDAAITGTQRAATVRFANRAPATVTMRLGEGLSAGGFALSQAELALVDAGTLEINGGSGRVEIGDLAFTANAGRTGVSVLTTGAMDITGTLTGTGAGRLFRFGGDGSATGMADQIRIVSAALGGGRLLFDNAGLELAGKRIVMGLANGFVDTILGGTPLDVGAVVGAYVSNPNSTLYNVGIGGQVYGDKTILTANNLTVRFGEYALFQNTEVAGQTSGVMLGGAGSATSPTLTIDGSASTGPDGFAIFGVINGVSGTGAALLGPSVIAVNGADLQNTRVNGCPVGTGVGCLTSVVVQPTLNVFDSSRLDVLRTAEELSLPFDPVVGTNNESLFSGVAALDPGIDDEACATNPNSDDCRTIQEEAVQ